MLLNTWNKVSSRISSWTQVSSGEMWKCVMLFQVPIIKVCELTAREFMLKGCQLLSFSSTCIAHSTPGLACALPPSPSIIYDYERLISFFTHSKCVWWCFAFYVRWKSPFVLVLLLFSWIFTAERLSLNRFPYYFIRLLVASPADYRFLKTFTMILSDTFLKCRQLCGMEISNFSWVFTFPVLGPPLFLLFFQQNFPCRRRTMCRLLICTWTMRTSVLCRWNYFCWGF